MGRIKRNKHGPEWYIQNDLRTFLQCRQWRVERMIGNALQNGIPDLYAFHRRHGPRWIDVKAPGKYDFTKAQKRKWPIWADFNNPIWILTAATQAEYDKLFKPANWADYWKPQWGEIPDIDQLLADLCAEEDEDTDS